MGLPRETRRDQTDEHLAPTLGADNATVADTTRLPAGTLLGEQYEVVRRLGQGGMGTVYVVEHTDLGRRFAAKVVSNSLSELALKRLMNEARVTSAIHHKNIVDVTHLGRNEDGSVFVIMELLKGEDLGQRLERQLDDHPDSAWLPDAELKRFVPQMLAGLRAAHEAGVIHRDMKPENVYLAAEGDGRITVKLLDFGIAKNIEPDGNHRLTRTGQIIGTPLYMAPEQARSMSDADNRADIYSIGVILYEMATGGPPFEADTLFDLIVQHATMPPVRPRARRPGLPEPLEDVILRCLHKNREHRFATVEELQVAWANAWKGIALEPLDVPQEELNRPLSAETYVEPAAASGEVVVVRASTPRAPIFIGVALLALLVGGGAAWVFGGETTTTTPPVAELAPEPNVDPDGVSEEADVAAVPEVVRLVQSDPQGALVTRDGEALGSTPLNVRVAENAQVALVLSLPGFQPTTVTVTGDSDDRFVAQLERDGPVRRRRRRRSTQGHTQSQTSSDTEGQTEAPPTPHPRETSGRRRQSGNQLLLGLDSFDSDAEH